MKALLCKEFGPAEKLVLEDIVPVEPGEGQVVVEVKACGVNFPDTLIIEGKYQFKPDMPFAPGSDVAGIVTKVGEGVKRTKVGDHVLGVLGWGGFAEEVVANEESLIHLPSSLNFVTASAFAMPYATSYYALKDRARLQPRETLLVLGAAGGVGLAAVELGHLMGAKVIAAASSDEKLAVCHQYGADELINYSREDLKVRLKTLTGGNGVDVVYDPVGGPYSEIALRNTAWGGRFLVIGFSNGEIPRIPLNLALLKGCSIIGVFFGSFAQRDPKHTMQNFRQLLMWIDEGKIKPLISATFPLEQGAEAIKRIAARQVMGKIVVVADHL
ncbi:NADPH:quinone oxidoreductase family protein [Dictyobacter kobayashii]|uniref:NADPH:quinone oxidoreductase n=1 Tax=Dictyobacter kobayashii TaxID=2014872 RepID=A0A402AZJ6_9CHLR|nr:NADPH:quinone oxidoreductase family protein [Dictyobacter kobayashii]GCE24493.1 NADPH:quinone oxidoreductase [Dictyobacter kobayashii]